MYSVTIEGRRTAVPVHLDAQHGAFHGTNPELENMRDLCDFRESMN
jgi:hypothetical protein